MQVFPYMTNPAKIKPFLDHIQTARKPSKVTRNYLESAGFKSKNDRSLITIMKFIGFLDSSGIPTNVWQSYRDPKHSKSVLAEIMRTAYTDLFGMYENAFSKDNETLRSYFSSKTDVGKSTIDYIVMTFNTLCKFADFGAVPAEAIVPEPLTSPREKAARIPTEAPGLTININVQLTLPATDDETVYDKLFASLKRNLLS